MENTPDTYKSGSGLVVISAVVTIIALACSAVLLVMTIFGTFVNDPMMKQVFWWITFGIMVAGLIISTIGTRKAGDSRKLALITSFLGLATAIILIISLFIK